MSRHHRQHHLMRGRVEKEQNMKNEERRNSADIRQRRSTFSMFVFSLLSSFFSLVSVPLRGRGGETL